MQPYEDASFAADVLRLRFQIQAFFFFPGFSDKTALVKSWEIDIFFFFLPLRLLALLENVRWSMPFWKRSLSDVTEGTYTRIKPCLKSLSGAPTRRRWCGSSVGLL